MPPVETSSEEGSLAKSTGLKFIPFYSPAISKGRHSFTEEEELKFEKQLEEGYDIYDERYIAWKRIRHPSSLQTDNLHPATNHTGIGTTHLDSCNACSSHCDSSTHSTSTSDNHGLNPNSSYLHNCS